jgi:hypothetical protein
VAAGRGGYRLCSAVYEDAWAAGRAVEARCASGHAAAAAGCSCGLYGARRPRAAVRYLVGRDDPEIVHRVVGLVALWGLVFEGPDGWRASFAYPARIWVPPARTNGADAPALEVELALGAYGARVEALAAYEPAAIAAELGGLDALDDPERVRRARAA